MRIEIDRASLKSAFDTALDHLLGLMRPEGYWEGRLSSSALSTATAVSALSLAGAESDVERIRAGVEWLARTQCPDGGWGDTPDSPSNLSTTLLAASALKLAGPERTSESARRADGYIAKCAGATSREISAAVREKYGVDRTFAVPILMNCALAGLVDWRDVPGLPYELAVFPRSWFKALKLQVVSYALPALIAVGLGIEHHSPSANPITRLVRRAVKGNALKKLTALQPSNGGFLEATPLTSFVAMSLIPVVGPDHPIAEKCLGFIRASQRADGSWPIDTNLANWVTCCAVAALSGADRLDMIDTAQTAAWISEGQYHETHPFTGAAPGGWGWTHLPGSVPDVDDTSGAILALTSMVRHIHVPDGLHRLHATDAAIASSETPSPLAGEGRGEGDSLGLHRLHAADAAIASSETPSPLAGEGRGEGDSKDVLGRDFVLGRDLKSRPNGGALPAALQWLLGLQNADGGWPTFCRGWGRLPFDKSSPDITAHAMRALLSVDRGGENCAAVRAVERGVSYLANVQRPDGSWVPLWFGNQSVPDGSNPVLGTARVLPTLADLRPGSPEAAKGARFLLDAQNTDGGWGGDKGIPSSNEESALAMIALSHFLSAEIEQAVARGAHYLIECVHRDTWRTPSPIGLYFASLWYSEELYPVAWTLEALGRVLRLVEATQSG